MNILFLLRTDALSKPGGDVVQCNNLINELRFQGVNANLSIELNSPLTDVDIVHLINIDRPFETWQNFIHAKKHGKRMIISPIHHSYQAINEYESGSRTGYLRVLNKIFKSFSGREKIKNLYRALYKPKLIYCAVAQLVGDLMDKQRQILRGVDHWILSSEGERQLIWRDFGVSSPGDTVIYNGIDMSSTDSSEIDKIYDVLVVARIEARKNQIGIMEALHDCDLRIAFVGGINPFHKRYVQEYFATLAKMPNAKCLGKIPYEALPSLYRAAKVHVSASWFEVTPLVDLEAYFHGCNVVCSKNSFTPEYLGDRALYVDPADVSDIRAKVITALGREVDPDAMEYMDNNFTWAGAAQKLITVYEKVLQK
jgi:glycosyltransferase involved in cell wall biosynthesis